MDELERLKDGKRSDLLTKREQALARAGVRKVPMDMQLGVLLRKAFPGGFNEVIEEIVPFLAEHRGDYSDLLNLYQSTSPTDKGILKPEDYLAAVGMNVGEFLGEVTTATFNRGATVAAMMAAAAQPRVLQATIDAATAEKGGSVTDRQMLLQMTNMLAKPKGSEVNIHFDKGTVSVDSGDKPEVTGDSVLQFEGFSKQLATDIREGEGRKLLDAAVEPMDVDFSSEDVEDADEA